MTKNRRMMSNLRDGIDNFVGRMGDGVAVNLVKDTDMTWVVGVGALTPEQYADYLEDAHADSLHDTARD